MTKIAGVKVYGNPKALALTAIIIFTIVAIGLYLTSSKRKTEYFTVQFDNVDRLTEGDKVFLNGLEVGQVKSLRLDSERKILATLWIGQEIKLTKGSTFTIHADLLGQRHIEIDFVDNKELLDNKEIQKGYVQPVDTTRFKQLTIEQKDSLIKHDPIYRFADTLMTILRKSKDSISKE
jgi:ABC-type transporter Mla subunit MlaD